MGSLRGAHWTTYWFALLLSLVVSVGPAGELEAQTPPTGPAADTLTLQQQLLRLHTQVDSLQAIVQRLQQQVVADTVTPRPDDPLAEIRARARAAARAAEDPDTADPEVGRRREPQRETRFFGRERALQQLNPEITVGGDIFSVARQGAAGQDNFVIRELEVMFQSTLDPYSRALIMLEYEGPNVSMLPHTLPTAGQREIALAGAAEEDGMELAEAYAQWVNLPGGASLTAGRFRQRLGTYNRWHAHALPWQELPLPYQVYLGREGLAQTGASLYWMLPVYGFGSYQTWLEVTRSSNSRMFGESNSPSVLGHLNAFWDISDATYFEIGLSGLTGRHDPVAGLDSYSTGLLHLETGLRWAPPVRALYQGLDFRAAVMRHHGRNDDGTSRELYGGFAGAEYRFDYRWLAGLRADYVQLPDGGDETALVLAPTLTWWQSEYVRLRAEYNYLRRPDHDASQFLVQMTFALGPHKHDQY